VTASVHCIILNWRTAEMTLKSTRAAMTAMEGVEGAITIVDNDSQDGSFDLLTLATEGWHRVRVLQSGRNGGYGAGNNFAIRAGLPDGKRADFIQILNSDAFPAPDAISALRDVLLADPGLGAAASFIHGPTGEAHQTAFRFPTLLGEFEGAARTGPVTKLLKRHVVAPALPEASADVAWMAGASVMFRMDMLDQIGLFDEDFFLYFEETDLFLRAQKAGWRARYVRESRVEHIGSVSTGMKKWQRTPRYWFDSRWHYHRKNRGAWYAAAATLALLAGGAIYGLRRVISRKPRQDAPYFYRDLVRHSLGLW